MFLFQKKKERELSFLKYGTKTIGGPSLTFKILGLSKDHADQKPSYPSYPVPQSKLITGAQ